MLLLRRHASRDLVRWRYEDPHLGYPNRVETSQPALVGSQTQESDQDIPSCLREGSLAGGGLSDPVVGDRRSSSSLGFLAGSGCAGGRRQQVRNSRRYRCQVREIRRGVGQERAGLAVEFREKQTHTGANQRGSTGQEGRFLPGRHRHDRLVR